MHWYLNGGGGYAWSCLHLSVFACACDVLFGTAFTIKPFCGEGRDFGDRKALAGIDLKVLLDAGKLEAGVDAIKKEYQGETYIVELRPDGVIVAKVRDWEGTPMFTVSLETPSPPLFNPFFPFRPLVSLQLLICSQQRLDLQQQL